MSVRRVPLPAAIATEPLRALLRAVDEASEDAATSVVVFYGSAERFCGGMDLAATLHEDPVVGLRLFATFFQRVYRSPKPTVAVVEGPAVGGGVGVAAACDVVVATPNASFALPEALFGFLPAAILPVILERLTPQKARLMTLLGQGQSAEWARANGLVDDLVEPAAIDQAVKRWTRELSRVAPQRVGDLRRWIQTIPTLGTDAAIARGADLTIQYMAEPPVQAAVRRFVEEGTAPWIDR